MIFHQLVLFSQPRVSSLHIWRVLHCWLFVLGAGLQVTKLKPVINQGGSLGNNSPLLGFVYSSFISVLGSCLDWWDVWVQALCGQSVAQNTPTWLLQMTRVFTLSVTRCRCPFGHLHLNSWGTVGSAGLGLALFSPGRIFSFVNSTPLFV